MVRKKSEETLKNSLELYDQAIYKKLKKLYPNTIATFPDRAMFDSNNKSKVSLPLISSYRVSNDVDFSNVNHAHLFSGMRTSENVVTYSIPIELLYTIDIWGDSRNEADQLYYDLLFALYRKPNIELDMSDTDELKVFSMRLLEQSSSSNLFEQSLDQNRIYRYTLTYIINEARMMYRADATFITGVDTNIDLI